MYRNLIAALLLMALAAPALSQAVPYSRPIVVGTTSQQVLDANPARRRIVFHNPNATAKVAVCVSISRVNSATINCTVGGAGSFVLLPYAMLQIDGAGNPQASLPAIWNAISDTPSSSLTILEWE